MINLHQLKRYLKFCNSYKKLDLPTGLGFETHHIIPTSMGGGNRNLNKVVLPTRAHLIAHKMLFRANPNKKTAMAYRMMCVMPNKNHQRKQNTKTRAEGRNLNSLYGGHRGFKHSAATKLKMREAKLGKPGNRVNYKASEVTKKKQSDFNKERFQDFRKHPRYDSTKYHFIHESGISVYASKQTIVKIIFPNAGYTANGFARLVLGTRNIYQGWSLLYGNIETA